MSLPLESIRTPDPTRALSARGLSTIDPEGRPGSRRGRIGFVHLRFLSGVLVHLVERHGI